jgi:hypothetical protein
MVATEGKVRSGVEVATITPSMSFASSPALASAARAAWMASAEVVSSSAAKRRRSMPERARIHSSDVSRVASNSLLSTMRAGR